MSKRIEIDRRLWVRRDEERRKEERRAINIPVDIDNRVNQRRKVERRKIEKRKNERRNK
ncbi:MAG: hypothetical protein HY919_01470 [Elusimicrobia bacterium]|nr:hypothetical protein [Elusimicrobiota bacterium]